MNEGWVALHRKIKDWQHYQNPTVRVIFEDLLLDACHEPIWHHGVRLNVGEVATSLSLLEQNTGLSRHTIIEALRKLETSGEITRKRCKNYTIIKVRKYALYQNIIQRSSAINAPPNLQGGATIAPHTPEGSAAGGATIAPITIKQQDNNSCCRDNARAREKLKAEAFGDMKVETACYSLKISEDEYKTLVEQVFSDWDFADTPDHEWNFNHLLNVLRYKVRDLRNQQQKRNNGTTTTNNGGTPISNGTNPLSRAKSYRAQIGNKHDE